MALLFTNNSQSVLASGVSSSATSMAVTSGHGARFPLPSGGNTFRATLVRASDGGVEVVDVTARSTDTMTVVRGQEGTTGIALAAGDKFELRITASYLNANTGDETGARIATLHHAASTKSALVDADEVTGGDSTSGFSLIRTTWTDVKTFLKTYFDTLYLGISATAANASQLLGATWASPAAIGTTAPAAAKFTTLETTGNVGLGGAIVAGTKLQIGGTITGGGGYGRTVNAINTIASDNTVEYITYFSVPYTQAAVFTLPSLTHFKAILGSIGAGSVIGNQYGFLADSTLVGATNNYGFYSNIPTAAGRYNFYAAGDAPNRFVGETLVIGPAGLGYGIGAGGTATQATSRTTGVTLSKPTGKITLFSTTATTGTFASFTLTNTLIAATDVVIVNFASATSADKYSLFVTAVAAGSCRIQVYNIAAVAVAEAPVINFAVIKGATS